MHKGTILWWGRTDNEYSRNRIIRKLLQEMGWMLIDFSPRFSSIADFEARLKKLPQTDLVWVPVFRQRDVKAAYRWSHSHNIPLVFDPLISAYDKQVYERFKLKPESPAAKRLLKWETKLFQWADIVLADTSSHAEYYTKQFNLTKDKVMQVYVGAEEALFKPMESEVDQPPRKTFDVLFYGSFIPLQGPETIVKAACVYDGPDAVWTLVGDGPLRLACEKIAKDKNAEHVHFQSWLNYHEELPARISQADLLLGIFGNTDKAGRVIPNKVFQSMAMAKPVVTRSANAFPDKVRTANGITWVKAADPAELAQAVADVLNDKEQLFQRGKSSYETFQQYFSYPILKNQLQDVMVKLGL